MTLPATTTQAEEPLDLALLEKEKETILKQARVYVATDATQYALGGDLLKLIKNGKAFLSRMLDPVVEKAHAAHKSAVAIRATFLEPLDKADQHVRKHMAAWHDEQAKIAREAAAAEAKRIADELAANKLKGAQEAEARAAQSRLESESLVAQAEDEEDPVMADMMRHEAELAAQSAASAQAEAVTIAAAPVVPVHVAPVTTAPFIPGIGTAENWDCDVTDLKALLTAIVAGEAPITYVMPDMVAIRRQVKKDKDKFTCPGVTTKRVTSMRVGGA